MIIISCISLRLFSIILWTVWWTLNSLLLLFCPKLGIFLDLASRDTLFYFISFLLLRLPLSSSLLTLLHVNSSSPWLWKCTVARTLISRLPILLLPLIRHATAVCLLSFLIDSWSSVSVPLHAVPVAALCIICIHYGSCLKGLCHETFHIKKISNRPT